MRKLLWCCSAAGVLAVGSLFSTAYLVCQYPDSTVAHCLSAAANSSLAMQPVTGLATLVAKVTHQIAKPHDATCTPGSSEECVPAEPQVIEFEAAEVDAGKAVPEHQADVELAPIVIHEDDPLPRNNEVEALPSTIELAGAEDEQKAGNACPMFMPYCNDDEAMTKPNVPVAKDEGKKQADGSEESDDSAYKAWMKLFEGANQEDKSSPAEELPAPKEESQTEPKCQEDSHLHEHYSGCPHTTCPYTGKSYPSCPPSMKSGNEESSEEPATPPAHHGKKAHKSKEKSQCTEGVDTMEYRPSDGGLNEYGPGPM